MLRVIVLLALILIHVRIYIGTCISTSCGVTDVQSRGADVLLTAHSVVH